MLSRREFPDMYNDLTKGVISGPVFVPSCTCKMASVEGGYK